MTKLLISVYLMFKLTSRCLELDRDLFLLLWRNQPAIEIFEEGIGARVRRLEVQIDAVFPF